MAEKDIVPELIEDILRDFRIELENSKVCENYFNRIRDGTGGFKEADLFATETGRLLSDVLRNQITTERLPDGKLYYNIADRVLNSAFDENFTVVSKVSEMAQDVINQKADLQIASKPPEKNQLRIKNLVQKISGYKLFEEAQWLLGEPVINISRSVVTECIKANADFHKELGLRSIIERFESGNCCDYCKKLSGRYDYGKQPLDFFKQHENCRCFIEYTPLKGKKISYTKIRGQKTKIL